MAQRKLHSRFTSVIANSHWEERQSTLSLISIGRDKQIVKSNRVQEKVDTSNMRRTRAGPGNERQRSDMHDSHIAIQSAQNLTVLTLSFIMNVC